MPEIYTHAEARALMQAHSIAGGHDETRSGRQPQENPIHDLVARAINSLGYVEHDRGEGRVLRAPKIAATNGELSFVETIRLDGGGRGVVNLSPGETTEIDPLAVVRQNSMVARAGGNIALVDKDHSPALWDFTAGAPLQTAIGRVVLPAQFQSVADGSSATVQSKPVADATFSLSDLPAYAAAFKISRAERRALGGDTLEDAVTAGVIRGIGQLVDQVALTAVAAASPAVFSYGALAALHLGVDDVSGIIGTAGSGALTWPDGSFRTTQGVPAKLTAGHTGSFIGVWGHAIVVMYPEIRFIAERLNTQGDLNIVTFINLKAVLPHPASFWTVS